MTVGPLGAEGQRGSDSPDGQLLLAFVAFLLVYGQPTIVCARVLLSVSLPVLGAIVGGSMLLAAPTARAFVRQGGSVSRLADLVIVAALVQIAGTLLGELVVTSPNSDGLTDVGRAAIVLTSFPIAYYAIYRTGGGSLLPDGFRS